jgi:histidyl-tRNA synthetase
MSLLGGEGVDNLSSGPLAASPAAEDVRRLLDLADAMGFADYLKFDSGVVRGLSYYTGTVFEGFDAERRFRAIFGGGRYDNLFGDMTGVGRPAVGMGFGDVVIAEILTELKGFVPAKLAVEVCVGRPSSRGTGGRWGSNGPGIHCRQARKVFWICRQTRRPLHRLPGAE